ncbi:unnamed protein product [Sympodiomycopsis kandeliae]
MGDGSTPRRPRATYGGSAKRRRLTAAVQSSSQSDQSDLDASPIKKELAAPSPDVIIASKTTPAQTRLAQRQRQGSPSERHHHSITPTSLDNSKAATRQSPRKHPPGETDTISRPCTPPPRQVRPLDDDLVQAFELASPGSSQQSQASIYAHLQANATVESQDGSEHFDSFLDPSDDEQSQQQRPKKSGLAARMAKAKAKRRVGSDVVDSDGRDTPIEQDPAQDLVIPPSSHLSATQPGTSRSGSSSGAQLIQRPGRRAQYLGSRHASGSYSQPTELESDLDRSHHPHSTSAAESQPVVQPFSPLARSSRAVTPEAKYSSPKKYSQQYLSPGLVDTKTYGGGLRTFLSAQQSPKPSATDSQGDEGEDVLNDRSQQQQQQHQRESYAELRSKWVIEVADTTLDGGASGSTQQPSLRSLSNLRFSGSLRRFNDELEYILVGLDPGKDLSSRRRAAVGLLSQLCGTTDSKGGDQDKDNDDDDGHISGDASSSFLHRLKAVRGQGKIWQAVRRAGGGEGQDEILDWCLALMILYLSRKNAFGDDFLLGSASDVSQCLSRIIAGYRQRITSGHVRSCEEEKMVNSLCSLFERCCSPLDLEGSATVLVVALSVICTLGSSTKVASIQRALFVDEETRMNGQLSELLMAVSQPHHNPLGASTSSLATLDHIALVAEALELDDVYSDTNGADDDGEVSGVEDFSECIRTLLHSIHTREDKHVQRGMRAMSSLLRLGLSQSRRVEDWTSGFAGSQSSDESGNGVHVLVHIIDDLAGSPDKERFDAVCLAVALLTNVLETCPPAMSTNNDDEEKTPAKLLYSLCAPHRSRAVEGLGAEIITEQAESNANSSFLSGCLAVILALAIQADEECLNALSEQASRPIDLIVDCLQDLCALSRAARARAGAYLTSQDGGGDDEGGEELSDRLLHSMLQLRGSS